jgi:methylated-DNA-protein-cysteine methyltransferase-like protein
MPKPNRTSSLWLAIESAISNLQSGEVVSFGDVAARAGFPKAARATGALLADGADTLPWWRVVYSSGHLPPCNPGLQAAKLADEGVTLKGFRVVAAPKGRFCSKSR